jgi:hypothetical protein
LDARSKIVGLDLRLNRVEIGMGGMDLAQKPLVALELGLVVTLQRYPSLILLDDVE